MPHVTLLGETAVPHFRVSRGFTLVEVLVATVLVLIMLATVVTVFARMADSMSESRAMIEVNDRLRHAKDRLQADLAGATAPMMPTQRPESGVGYTEIIEGPVGPILRPNQYDSDYDGDIDNADTIDLTVGDNDDILMLTTRSSGEPFVGRFGTSTAQSQVAEVCWFLRGTTLYRRQLLVAPALETTLDTIDVNWRTSSGFYAKYDLSVRQEGGTHDWRTGGVAATARLELNTLGDLTKRENRYGHQPWAIPHDARFWGPLGLPTLRECSSPDWPFPYTEDVAGTAAMEPDSPYYAPALGQKYIVPNGLSTTSLTDAAGNLTPVVDLTGQVDPWTAPFPWTATNDAVHGTLLNYSNGTRLADDVILTNVLSFDVKVWDPGAPIFDDNNSPAVDVITPSGEYPEQDTYKTKAKAFFSAPTYLSVADKPIAYGAYVDLNYCGGSNFTSSYPQADLLANIPRASFFGPFYGPGDNKVRVTGYPLNLPAPASGMLAAPATYDTWSFHYEHDGFDQDLQFGVDQATNGLDDNNLGGVDDDTEREAPPPYPVPLRGIQVKIRVFEPGTRQIREVTVVQDFVAQ